MALPSRADDGVDPVLRELDGVADGIRRRDEGAFARAYQLTADLLASIAVGIVGDRQLAEDAVQEAFVSLVQAADRFQGDGRSLRAWLVKATRHRCIDHLRSAASRREETPGELPDDPRPAVDPFGDDPDPGFVAAFSQLTEEQRTVLVLRHVAGMSGEEVADVVGSNRDAVYAQAARAERRLRKLLARPSGPSDRDRTDRLQR